MKRKTGEMAQTENPFMKIFKNSRKSKALRLRAAIGILISAALLVGCGGGDSGGHMASSSPSLLSGIFVDSAVEGLEYETETQSGVTDADGTFMYMPGETITFYVGDIMLGGAMAKSMMTPVDLVDGAVDETHPMVTNMARFLQTLDSDMNPDNGITITWEMADAMIGHMLDFDMDMDAFEYDPNMQAVMDTVNMMGSSGTGHMMVSIEDAQNHLGSTMANIMTGNSGMMDSGGMVSNDGSTMPSGSDMMIGTFVNSPVEGLEYETETQSGVTDMDGSFMFRAGETVTFYVGDVMLGGAMARAMMTPVDLVEGATDETHPMVLNMARFLLTLDADMNPENGITITEEMADAMIGHMVDFDMNMDTFGHSTDMQAVMGTINMMNSYGTGHTMASIEDAQNYLAITMAGIMYDDSGMVADDSGMMDSSGMTGNHSDTETGGAGVMPGDQTTMPGGDTGMMSPGSGMM